MSRSVAVWILVAFAAIAALFAGWVLLRGPAESSGPREPLTGEEKAYLSKIRVTDARMSAAQNYLGDTITFLDARITNQGSKPVRDVEVQLEFVDTFDQVVLRDSTHAVTTRMPPLDPGKTRAFRVSYDRMPAEWNLASPKITVTRVSF
jgi:hypothetical protein